MAESPTGQWLAAVSPSGSEHEVYVAWLGSSLKHRPKNTQRLNRKEATLIRVQSLSITDNTSNNCIDLVGREPRHKVARPYVCIRRSVEEVIAANTPRSSRAIEPSPIMAQSATTPSTSRPGLDSRKGNFFLADALTDAVDSRSSTGRFNTCLFGDRLFSRNGMDFGRFR
jgi:hypothetical protein